MLFYKDPSGVLHYHVLGTRVADFLFLGRFAEYLLERGWGGGHQRTVALDAPRQELGGTSTNVLSAEYFKPKCL